MDYMINVLSNDHNGEYPGVRVGGGVVGRGRAGISGGGAASHSCEESGGTEVEAPGGEEVFRCVVNIRLISCCSDLGVFSPPHRPSLILNVGSVVSRPYFVMLSMHIRVPSISTLISLRSGLTRAAFTRAATTKS